MFRTIVSYLVLVSLWSGCNSTDDDALIVPDKIINNSLGMFDGTVLMREATEVGTLAVWKVQIRNNKGSVVEFFWNQLDDNLYKIEGLKGPYDDNYDVVPGNGLVNFKSAQFAATSELKNDALRIWILKKENDFADLWIYSLIYNENNGQVTAYVNANNGEVLEID
jgi:uncharacterized membrane protein YkoI